MRCIAYLGGTFDPIHYGHLRSAAELKQRLGFDAMVLVPCHRPPHRGVTGASGLQRLTMVQLALTEFPQLQLDDCELQRPQLSYTVETLRHLRRQHGPTTSLCWVMGMDAFAGLDRWYHWQRLLDLAHLVVIARPGEEKPASGAVAAFAQGHGLVRRQQLKELAAGGIWFEELTPHSVSATAIRQNIAHCRSVSGQLPDAVTDYIKQQGLYCDPATTSSE